MMKTEHEDQMTKIAEMDYRSSISFMILGVAVFVTSILFQYFTMNVNVTSGIEIAIHLVDAGGFLLWGSMVFAFGWTRLEKPSGTLVRNLAVVGLTTPFFIIIIFDPLLLFFSKVLVPYYLLIDAMTPFLIAISMIFYSRRLYGKRQTEYKD